MARSLAATSLARMRVLFADRVDFVPSDPLSVIEPIDQWSQALSCLTTRFSTTKPTSTARTIATRDQSRLPVSSSINHRVNELRLRMTSVGINSIGFIIVADLKRISGECIGAI